MEKPVILLILLKLKRQLYTNSLTTLVIQKLETSKVRLKLPMENL